MTPMSDCPNLGEHRETKTTNKRASTATNHNIAHQPNRTQCCTSQTTRACRKGRSQTNGKTKGVIMSYIKELHISHKYLCTECYGNHVDTARAKHLKDNNLRMTCHTCGEILAKQRRHTIAPLNKSNYVCITDMAMLKQLNPKRTT